MKLLQSRLPAIFSQIWMSHTSLNTTMGHDYDIVPKPSIHRGHLILLCNCYLFIYFFYGVRITRLLSTLQLWRLVLTNISTLNLLVNMLTLTVGSSNVSTWSLIHFIRKEEKTNNQMTTLRWSKCVYPAWRESWKANNFISLHTTWSFSNSPK